MSAELPKMPEPDGYFTNKLGTVPAYMARTMQEYAQEAARQAMETAAKAVREGLMMEPLTAEKIIRALIPPPPTSGNGEGGGNG